MIRQGFQGVCERWLGLLLSIFAVVLGLSLCAPQAFAQATATINGTVRDSAGAVITDAQVVLHNRDTNLDRYAATNSAGAYVMPEVQPGSYDLKVTKAAFAAAVKSGIVLLVNQTATYDFSLKTGTINQVVEVQANAETLETSTSELGAVVVKEQVNDLPLNGRNFTQLLSLTPGVSTINVSQNSTASGGVWSNPIGTFVYPSVNGQSNRSNLFLLDGVNDEGSFGGTYAVAPIVDDVQEFKVQSHNDDASFGGVMGGVVNVVTKSGTSQFHGSAWEFIRNKAFDAENYFFHYPEYQQNQFGFTFGGPLPIPGEHLKKTFFFLSYEGYRNHTASSSPYNVPTPAQLTGDFSTDAQQIYNPYNYVAGTIQPFLCSAPGVPEPAVNGVQTGGLPCNYIPSNMIDPNMVTYAQKLFPAANNTPTVAFPYNGVDTTKADTRQDEGNGRLDHQFSEKDSVWGRYTAFRQPVSDSGGYIGLLHSQVTDGYNLGTSYTHLFSGTTLATAHFSHTNVNIDQGTTFANENGSFAPTIFNPDFVSGFQGGASIIPQVYIQGYLGNANASAHGAAQVDHTRVSDIWEFGGDFTKTIGHHTFKAGVNFASNNSDALYLNNSVQFFAANTANSAVEGSGDGLASFLLGDPNSASRRNVIETEHGGWVDGFYAMDQWKVTNKLNINIGLRYDLTVVPIYGSDGAMNNNVGDMNFRNGTYVLETPLPNGEALPAHVVVTPLSNGAIYHTDYNDIQPRVGVAYQVLPNTVIRAGYGRFFDNWGAITQTAQNFEGTWPSTNQLGVGGLNPIGTPPTTTAENPINVAAAAASPFAQATWFADPYLKRPYTDQWNFGVQQQITSNAVLTANYVGSVGRRLDVGGEYNVATVAGGNLNTSCAPYSTSGATNCGAPYPYIGPTPYDRSAGKSTYNALQLSLTGRQQHGLTYLISYTWSKSLDLGCSGWYGVEGCSVQNPYDLQGSKGPSGQDLPQIFSAAWVYALPFGKQGKLASGNPVVNHIIGGWNLNGVLTLYSGQAFDVGNSEADDTAETGNTYGNFGNGYDGYERADVIGPLYASHKGPAQWLSPIGVGYAVPALGTFGDLGRDSLRSDWSKNLDLSIFRQIPITERFRVEFRFETFNVTNTPVWAVPSSSLDTPSQFGKVSSTANVPRQLQFALKLYF
jgi:hypothetical protein